MTEETPLRAVLSTARQSGILIATCMLRDTPGWVDALHEAKARGLIEESGSRYIITAAGDAELEGMPWN